MIRTMARLKAGRTALIAPALALLASAASAMEPLRSDGVPSLQIAREVAIAIVYNGISHAVMMATPRDLEAFAIGFSLTEQIVKSIDEIQNLEIDEQSLGFEINLQISNRSFTNLKERRRNLMGRTGCGICGLESLEQLSFANLQVSINCELSHLAINSAVAKLRAYQPLQSLTGAVHGAAWCDRQGNIVNLLEDVGRHNALDKLVGTLAGDNKLKQNELANGFLLISSRASYEMVQKAAISNIPILVAVSAPTSLAIRLATETNVTLVGFARDGRHICYTNSRRLK